MLDPAGRPVRPASFPRRGSVAGGMRAAVSSEAFFPGGDGLLVDGCRCVFRWRRLDARVVPVRLRRRRRVRHQSARSLRRGVSGGVVHSVRAVAGMRIWRGAGNFFSRAGRAIRRVSVAFRSSAGGPPVTWKKAVAQGLFRWPFRGFPCGHARESLCANGFKGSVDFPVNKLWTSRRPFD